MGYGFSEKQQSETDDPKTANKTSVNEIFFKFSFQKPKIYQKNSEIKVSQKFIFNSDNACNLSVNLLKYISTAFRNRESRIEND